MSKLFDQKLGKDFLSSVPAQPGVYRIYDSKAALIYVGKSKNLRRRISQYRNAKRRKKHAKMRAIVADAARLEFEVCSTEREALLRENELIQSVRPKWNIAGAFHFLYPMIGVHRVHGYAYFCYTTSPEKFPEFQFHGAFRSRSITREGFRALMELLSWVGTPLPRSRLFAKGGFARRDRFSEVAGLRSLTPDWLERLDSFFTGDSREALEELVLSLADAPAARKKPKVVQRNLNALKCLWRHETTRLRKARQLAQFSAYPVPQAERDRLFILSTRKEV